MQICLYSRIVVFLFNIKKSCLYKDQIRFFKSSINNNTNSKIAIQKQSSFFEFCIAIVVDVAILTIIIKGAKIAIIVISLEFVKIVVNFVSNIDRYFSIIITIALQIVYFVYFNIICNLFSSKRINDCSIVNKYN